MVYSRLPGPLLLLHSLKQTEKQHIIALIMTQFNVTRPRKCKTICALVELNFGTLSRVISGYIHILGLLSVVRPWPNPCLSSKNHGYCGIINLNHYPFSQNPPKFKKVKQSSASIAHPISLWYSLSVCSSIMNQFSQILLDGAGLTGGQGLC